MIKVKIIKGALAEKTTQKGETKQRKKKRIGLIIHEVVLFLLNDLVFGRVLSEETRTKVLLFLLQGLDWFNS